MLKIVLYAITLCFTFIGGAFAQVAPPQHYIVYHRWPADIDSPYGRNMMSKIDRFMHSSAGANAVSWQLKAGEKVRLLTSEWHTYPTQNRIHVKCMPTMVERELKRYNKDKKLPEAGDDIYLLGYIGEGMCEVWYENQMLFIITDGIENFNYPVANTYGYWAEYMGPKVIKEELWICLENAELKQGWTKYGGYKGWKRFGSDIFFREGDAYGKSDTAARRNMAAFQG